jgi:hypothetical protein
MEAAYMRRRQRSEAKGPEGKITCYGGIGQGLPSRARQASMRPRDHTVGAIHGRTPQEQLEVVLQQDGEGRWGLTLIAQGWGEGIGWYPQKTIALDASQIEPLQRMLAIVQGVTRRARSRRDRDGERPPFLAPPSGEDRGLQCG